MQMNHILKKLSIFESQYSIIKCSFLIYFILLILFVFLFDSKSLNKESMNV